MKVSSSSGHVARNILLSSLLLALASASDAQSEADGSAADAAANPGSEAASQGVTGDGSPASLRAVRDAFIAAADFEAALAPAEQAVEQAESRVDPQLPTDLSRLARIQSELDDFAAAELSYLEAIELLEETEGENSISLVEPYQGLGRSYIRSRQFPEAVTALGQAQHISQRNLGLFNVTQTALIDDLTNAYLGMGDTVTAQRLQLERLDNAIRRFGPDSVEVVPFRYALASYYDKSRMREAAREQYEHVAATLEDTPDAMSQRLDALRRLMRIELLLGDGADARSKLVALLDGADVEPLDRARSLTALGDWAIATEDVAAARDYYANAHELLRMAPGAERDDALEGPAMLDFIAPLTPVDRGARSRRSYAWGEIVLEFDVTAEGRASGVETVAATPPGLMEEAYERRVRETHFRPRLVAGVPRTTENVRFTHYFRYYVTD